MSDTLDRLEALVAEARKSVEQVGDGDWTPQDTYLKLLADAAALVAVARAAETYEEAVESGSAKEDGGIALQVTYRQLREALAALDRPEAKP